ncbi:alpha/beta fold family hydrolase [Metarhizium brunneum]
MEAQPEQFLTRPGGVKVCYQTFGRSGATPLLLLSGGAQSMLCWHEDFISMVDQQLGGSFIIRFDYRDTGRSTNFPLGEAAHYSINDLCDDAVAILDELRIESANLVGFSLGGAIAWMIAAQHPQRVKSLSLFSSSPVGPSPSDQDALPQLNPELGAQLAKAPIPSDWQNQEMVLDFLMFCVDCTSFRKYDGREREDMYRRQAAEFARISRQGNSVQSIFNQSAAVSGRWPRELLCNVKCPTTIVHGREDRNIPLVHADVLKEEIKGSKLVVVESMAHEMPKREWSRFVRAIASTCI